MNCLEFRRVLLTEPSSRDGAFLAHQRECAECAASVGRSNRFERLLKEAARVEVPENLASRVLVRQTFRAAQVPLWRRPRLLALAACLVVGIGVAIGIGIERGGTRALHVELVTLVNQAPHALASSTLVADEAIAAALRPVGLGVDGELGQVTFASRCFVRGLLSGHLVVRGETAPVTIFLIPESLVGARSSIENNLFSGVVMPVSNGTIAIVGAPGEQLGPIEHQVLNAVRWRV